MARRNFKFKNQEHWNELFQLPVFRVHTGSTPEQRDRAWKWALKIADSGNLSQADITWLKALLEVCLEFDEEAY